MEGKGWSGEGSEGGCGVGGKELAVLPLLGQPSSEYIVEDVEALAQRSGTKAGSAS
jgi:hypothetical protein